MQIKHFENILKVLVKHGHHLYAPVSKKLKKRNSAF